MFIIRDFFIRDVFQKWLIADNESWLYKRKHNLNMSEHSMTNGNAQWIRGNEEVDNRKQDIKVRNHETDRMEHKIDMAKHQVNCRFHTEHQREGERRLELEWHTEKETQKCTGSSEVKGDTWDGTRKIRGAQRNQGITMAKEPQNTIPGRPAVERIGRTVPMMSRSWKCTKAK